MVRKASFCKVSSFLSLSFCSHKKSDTSKEKGWWELCVWMDQGWLTLVVECNQDPACEAGLSGSMTWRQSHCHLQSDNPALLQKSLRPKKVVKKENQSRSVHCCQASKTYVSGTICIAYRVLWSVEWCTVYQIGRKGQRHGKRRWVHFALVAGMSKRCWNTDP